MHGALESLHGFDGGGKVVVADGLDLVSVDAPLRVDLVGGDLGRLKYRQAGDRLRLGDHADPDRFAVRPRGRRR